MNLSTFEIKTDASTCYALRVRIDSLLEKAQLRLSRIEGLEGLRIFLTIEEHIGACLDGLGLSRAMPEGCAEFTTYMQRIETGITLAIGEVFVMDDDDLAVGEWLLERLAGQIKEVCDRLDLLKGWQLEAATMELESETQHYDDN